MTHVPATVAAYFSAVNQQDWDDLAMLFTPDAEIHPVGSRPRQGREEVLAYYPRILAAFAEHEDVVERAHVAGDVVTAEISFTGRTHEGVPVRFRAVDVFDLSDDRIARISLWYDTADVLRQVRGGGEA